MKQIIPSCFSWISSLCFRNHWVVQGTVIQLNVLYRQRLTFTRNIRLGLKVQPKVVRPSHTLSAFKHGSYLTAVTVLNKTQHQVLVYPFRFVHNGTTIRFAQAGRTLYINPLFLAGFQYVIKGLQLRKLEKLQRQISSTPSNFLFSLPIWRPDCFFEYLENELTPRLGEYVPRFSLEWTSEVKL